MSLSRKLDSLRDGDIVKLDLQDFHDVRDELHSHETLYLSIDFSSDAQFYTLNKEQSLKVIDAEIGNELYREELES